MYRLAKAQGISLQSVYSSSRQLNRRQSFELYSFYNVYHWNTWLVLCYLQNCQYKTTANDVELNILLKRKDRSKKKFAELLEVTEQSLSNRKALVKTLNATHLSVLANQPDITLDKLHKITNFFHTNLNKKNSKLSDVQLEGDNTQDSIKESLTPSMDFGALKSTAYLEDKATWINEDLNEYGITDQATLIKNFNLLTTIDPTNSVINNEKKLVKSYSPFKKCSGENAQKSKVDKKNKNNSQMNSTTELNKTQEEQTFIEYGQRLLAQMEIYIACGMLNHAYKYLFSPRSSTQRISQTVQRQLADMLLEAYATKGDLAEVLDLHQLVISKSLPPTPHTYAILFEIISKISHKKTQLDLLKKVELEMQQNKISLDDIFNKSPFKKNQRQDVLRVVQLIKPDYQPKYSLPDSNYVCHLLKDITSSNISESPVAGLFKTEDLMQLLKKQVQHERESDIYIKSVESFDNLSNTQQRYKLKVDSLEKSWEKAVSKAFDRNLSYLKQKEKNARISSLILHPFLEVLDKKEYTNAIMREIRKLIRTSEAFSMSIMSLNISLADYIYKKYEIQAKTQDGILEKTLMIHKKYLQWYLREDTSRSKCPPNSRIAWQKILHKLQSNGASLDRQYSQWPTIVRLNVGKFLYKIILNDVKFCVDINKMKQKHFAPVFFSAYRHSGVKLIEQIKAHPAICKLYKESSTGYLAFDTTLLPTVCPPRPWTSLQTGGYLISEAPFVRLHTHTEYKQMKFLNSVPLNQLYPALDSLNQLGSIPWKINKPVLNIIIKIFQDGGSVKLDIPQPPSVLPPIPLLNKNTSIEDIKQIEKTRMQMKEKKMEMYSLWCDCLYKLSIAHHFKDQIFWLPHNFDFRGRVYPVPPHLNHLGSDFARSLLTFAQRKPLGPKGLDWLKIHTINLTGFKKQNTITERLKFANENLDKIIDSAENPLTGEMWWASSEEPWQTLAVCMEINNILKSPKPEEYMSGFPVHQDGSCNGLQHYAALGKDTMGAKSVNLCSLDRPQDVYSTVVALVDKQREIDAKNGNEIARILEGCVKRKVIKQTVMTTVYGVTKFGARLQIIKQLKLIDDFPRERIWEASAYLVSKTFECLVTMFTSAKEIQDWFTECARIISTKFGEPVKWITPLGLPVMQPYYRHQKVIPRNKKHQKVVLIEVPDTVKQKNAFPPNFIHSLDSTHMMLTALFCEKNNIAFTSVHDCFWTHPCTIDTMNQICRQQFVALHSEPILENLSKFFINAYLNHSDIMSNGPPENQMIKQAYECFLRIPQYGDFDLKQVLSSQYFFS